MITWPPSHGAIQMALPSDFKAPVFRRIAPIAKSASPASIATVSFHVVSKPPQYMMQFAEQKATGSSNAGAGTRYERGRPASTLWSAASDSGANAYMMATAPVTTATSAFQLLNGPS